MLIPFLFLLQFLFLLYIVKVAVGPLFKFSFEYTTLESIDEPNSTDHSLSHNEIKLAKALFLFYLR